MTKGINETIISLENISVRFRVPTERVASFKEHIIRLVQGRVRHREFWALRDINLNIPKGHGFGIIGRNGAGKTTLLKVISRVLQPTTGRVWVKGHVSPLLGIGAGFHPELTGRENVYLNGAMLGFTHQEMSEMFERIVNFAELWEFIDAPLRTYSSGMKARLGFAVATDVEPDILIVDEVLAVGDADFRVKCYERMASFQKQGATIIIVSHNMNMIRKNCQVVAWIHEGTIRSVGPSNEIVEVYQRSIEQLQE